MRAVAKALGVTPMALYHHVHGKAALAELVVELVISEHPLPAPTGASWRDDLWEMARWMRETMSAHPVVARLRRQYQVWTPSILGMTERWVGIWQQSGLEFNSAILAALTSRTAIIGAAEEEMVMMGLETPEHAILSMLPNARAALTTKRDRNSEFELLVRSVIDGLHQRLLSHE